MKASCNIFPNGHPFSAVRSAPILLLIGVLAGFGQTNIYTFTGSETNIILNPGNYDITVYGAQGGSAYVSRALGAEVRARFNLTTNTTLTLLVGGAGTDNGLRGSGGGGGGASIDMSHTNAGYGLTTSSGGNGVNGEFGGGGIGGSSGYGGRGGGSGYPPTPAEAEVAVTLVTAPMAISLAHSVSLAAGAGPLLIHRQRRLSPKYPGSPALTIQAMARSLLL